MSDITLSSAIRTNLISLQQTAALMGRTQERLATGKEVNSAVDDPSRFFAAQNHKSRSNDLLALKSDMGEAIQTIQAADKGITAIQSVLAQMKGLAASARSADAAGRTALTAQYNALTQQITDLTTDSNYKGTNLLKDANDLTVNFNSDGSSSITVASIDTTAAAYQPAVADLTTLVGIDAAVANIDGIVSAYRTASQSLATQLSVITTRQEFTQQISDVLETGAENLVNADSNRESANMLTLQTRQQLSTVAMSISSEAAQSILRLF